MSLGYEEQCLSKHGPLTGGKLNSDRAVRLSNVSATVDYLITVIADQGVIGSVSYTNR